MRERRGTPGGGGAGGDAGSHARAFCPGRAGVGGPWGATAGPCSPKACLGDVTV